MNNERRKAIDTIYWKLIGLPDEETVSECTYALEDILCDEQEYYDNIPKNFLDGENAERSSEAIDYLQEAIDLLGGIDFDDEDDVENTLSEASDLLQNAMA